MKKTSSRGIMKECSKSSAKKQTWTIFSQYIRLRDCLKTTGTSDRGKCFTCGREYHFKELQAGHFVAGRGNAVLFDELGVRAQCKRCNIFNHGEPLVYRRELIKELGEDIVDTMEMKKWRTRKYSIQELDCLRHYYIKKSKELLGEL